MIRGILGSSGVTVTTQNCALPFINKNEDIPMQGMLRVCGNDMQIFDTGIWKKLDMGYPTIGLTSEVQELLTWARVQIIVHRDRAVLAEKNPAMMNALTAIQAAEANFDILAKFVEND